ncbi:MAG: NifU family protein [Candidatus Poseidoniaceae archaeon]|jgi:Fe-S cluster biogenesis protein NfuA|nr:NifU family protein [Candidatus Poseidoniaceae archaeon]
MSDEDLVSKYAAEALESMKLEARKRIDDVIDKGEEKRLQSLSLIEIIDSSDIVPALLSRLNEVRAALDGHGGGIELTSYEILESSNKSLNIVLDLTGACLSCGAAPGTLESVKFDLESDAEISSVKFSSALLDSFDELGREFILAHGKVEFVN